MKRLLLLSIVLSVAACNGSKSSVREALGMNKSSPDEFKVVSRPPLSVPPEFSLRPPEPGAPPRGTASATDQAKSLVIDNEDPALSSGHDALDDFRPAASTTVTPVMTSTLESAADANFLSRAGANKADDTIRSQLRSDELSPPETENESSFALQEWLGLKPNSDVVDPEAESERIRENIEDGKPVNEGEVKTIESEQNTLDLLFE